MTKLLISVRDCDEARSAAENGADIIDLKEPWSGSLGRVSARVVNLICQSIEHIPISVAMGELTDAYCAPAFALSAAAAHGISFAKIGPARIASLDSWKSHWESWRDTLPESVQAIAVAYADFDIARSPVPLDLVEAAADLGAAGVLIDTFAKSSRDLTGCMSFSALQALTQFAAERQLPVALAGSVTTRTLPRLLSLRPAIIAVRGAVCGDGRMSRVCGTKVGHLASVIRRWCPGGAVPASHAMG